MTRRKGFFLLILIGLSLVVSGFSSLSEKSSGMPPGFILPFEGTVNITCGPEDGTHHPYNSFDSSGAMDFQISGRKEILLRAVAGGTAYVDVVPGFGRVVRISHSDGYQSFYAHLSRTLVSNGQTGIKQGDVIGYSGNSGYGGAGNHLHFEIRTGAGGAGKSNVYSGQAIDFSGDSRINYNPNGPLYQKGTAIGQPLRATRSFPTATPPSKIDLGIPDDALPCDIPVPWGTCLDNQGNEVRCGVKTDPATGLASTGDKVCWDEYQVACLYVTPDGGVACDR